MAALAAVAADVAAAAGAVDVGAVLVGAAAVAGSAVFAAGAGEACQRLRFFLLFRQKWDWPGKASPKWADAYTCASSRASLVARKSTHRQVRV